jgi:hypothetical protein
MLLDMLTFRRQAGSTARFSQSASCLLHGPWQSPVPQRPAAGSCRTPASGSSAIMRRSRPRLRQRFCWLQGPARAAASTPAAAPASPARAQDARVVAERFYAAYNAGDLDTIRSLIASDCSYHDMARCRGLPLSELVGCADTKLDLYHRSTRSHLRVQTRSWLTLPRSGLHKPARILWCLALAPHRHSVGPVRQRHNTCT